MKKEHILKRIKIETKDEVKGFYKLLTSKFSIQCLPDNEYIVPEDVLEELKEEKIEFNEIKHDYDIIKRTKII